MVDIQVASHLALTYPEIKKLAGLIEVDYECLAEFRNHVVPEAEEEVDKELALLGDLRQKLQEAEKRVAPCTCKFVAIGAPPDQSGCKVHQVRKYPCLWTKCPDYRPAKPFPNGVGHGWPLCICGEIAQEHG